MSENPIASATGPATIQLVANPAALHIEPDKPPKVRRDPDFAFVLFAACAIAFHLSALLTGLLAAWVYYWRN